MKKFNLKQIGATALIITISTSNISSKTVTASEINFVQETNTLKSILKQENITNKELNNFSNYIRKEIINQSINQPNNQSIDSTKITGPIRDSVIFILKHADKIPIKAVRDAVNKYRSKLINFFETLDAWTWYGISNGLIKIGIPPQVADIIADFIVTFFL